MNNFWSNDYIEYKINGDKNKILSVEEYLDKISLYLKGIINLKKSDTWKTQLTIRNNFISSLDNDEEGVMHSKNHNIEVMIIDEADEDSGWNDRGGSYIDSSDRIKNKKETINLINKKGHKCFQYAATDVLNYESTKNHKN